MKLTSVFSEKFSLLLFRGTYLLVKQGNIKFVQRTKQLTAVDLLKGNLYNLSKFFAKYAVPSSLMGVNDVNIFPRTPEGDSKAKVF